MASFDSWLIDMLNSKSIDGEVFGEYISGTLNTMEDASQNEIEEALTEILSGCVEEETCCLTLCQEITKQWLKEKENKDAACGPKTQGLPSFLPTSLPSDLVQTGNSGSRGASASSFGQSERVGLSSWEKERVLAQYDCESDEDEIGDSADVPVSVAPKKGSDSGGLFENINRSSLVEEARKMREQQKVTHENKVERDKQARQTQKQKVQDRKEKEKKRTQKQERRR